MLAPVGWEMPYLPRARFRSHCADTVPVNLQDIHTYQPNLCVGAPTTPKFLGAMAH
jgi:hypothetical protein